MKPINDNELSDIISKKIATVPDVETDHLWAGIESGLLRHQDSGQEY